MAAHARLKNRFTEDDKCHNLMKYGVRGSKWNLIVSVPDHCLFIYFLHFAVRMVQSTTQCFNKTLLVIFFNAV